MIGSGLGLNGSNYVILVGGGGGGSGRLSGFLLDDYPGTAAAFSLRKLSASYSGPAIRVREEGGNKESDIGFDSNGELDLATLATFCNGRVGRVVTWYDQSSAGNNATQSSSTNQPQIYNGTAVITENGEPALQLGRSPIKQLTTSAISWSTSLTAATVLQPTDDGAFYIKNWSIGTDATTRGYAHISMTGGSDVDWQRDDSAMFGDGYSATSNPRILTTGSAFTSGSQALSFLSLNSTAATLHVDGSEPTYRKQQTGNTSADSDILYINGGTTTGQGMNGTMQELILWPSDQSSNRTAIEDNINSDYLIYQPTTAPESGLLADYSGSAAAYSVRRLSDKALIAMRIRRDSDNAEINIGFNADGSLNTTAISDFCTTANGYVVQWMDQSTNGNHATQSSSTNQPQIYNGTAVITENGKPSLSGGLLSYSSVTYTNSVHSTFYVCRFDANAIYASAIGSGANQYQAAHRGTHFFERIGNVTTFHAFASSATKNAQHLIAILDDATTTTTSVDGTSGTVSSAGTWTAAVTLTHRGEYGVSSDVKVQELVIYNSNESTNRTGIETDINSEYLIYQPTDAPTSGLLATYTGAAAAYSVRQLSDKAVIAMRIRRDSDNAETNIGFDSNGDLDTQAIIDFCGVANGRVVQWMDQSTNGNHAVMTTQSLQPRIYDGSSINEINGKPAIDNESINTSGVGFTLSGVSVTQPYTIQSVFAAKANTNANTYAWGVQPLAYLRNDSSDAYSIVGGGNFVFSTANGNSITNPAQDCQVSTFISADATNLEIFASSNNAQESGTTTGTVTTYTPTYLTNRRVGDISKYHFQEYILWDSDYTGDHSSIENNINSYFSIH